MAISRMKIMTAVLAVSREKCSDREIYTEKTLDGGVTVNIEEAEPVRVPEVSSILDCSQETVRRVFEELDSADVIEQDKSGYNTTCVIVAEPDEIMEKVKILDK